MYWAGIPLLCNCINNNYYILCWRLAAILKDELPSIAVGVFLNGVAFDITHVSTKLLGGSVLCNFNVSLGNVHSGTVSLESLSYEHNTDDRDDGAETCCDKHPLGPFGHFSLSTKILLAAPFLLLPAFFYRLNFKATAWFWWLLAYLLKPAPVGDKAEQQKQALCWPWTNPLEMILIVGPLAALLTSLISHYLNGSSWAAMKDVPYLPLRVLFSMDWADVTPWHWMQWVIVGSGAWMLKIAGNARSQDLNGNWQTYSQSWSKTIRLMTALQRIRALATLALLIMGLGALLLLDQTWREYVTVPDYWVAVLEQFYRRGH